MRRSRRPAGRAHVHRTARLRWIAPALLAVILAGCGATPPTASGPPDPAATSGLATPDGSPTAAAGDQAAGAATPVPPPPSAVTSATAGPSGSGACALPDLALRAAQVLLVGIPGTTAAVGGGDVAAAGVGGVLLFGANLVDAHQVRAFTSDLQARAPLPLAIATDEEPGRIGRLAGAGIIAATPSARSLGGRPPATIEALAQRIGREMAALGLTVDLAPVLDVTGAGGGGVIGDRSFGADPAVVTRAGVAFLEGLDAAGIAAVGKHFPGHGETTVDSHTTLPVVTASLATLRRRAIPPFAAAVDAGIPAIMLGHLQVDAIDASWPTSLSARTVGLLRDDLGFTGLVTTDDLYMGGIADRWTAPEAVVLALRAGVDMPLLSTARDLPAVVAAIRAAVADGSLPESRLNDAFLRVERFKGVDRWAACTP